MFTKMYRRNPINNGYPGQIMQGNPYHQPWQQVYGRQVPYPLPNQPLNWQPYLPQSSIYQQPYQQQNQQYPQGYVGNANTYQNQPYWQKDHQFLFQNPLQPQEEYYPSPNQYPQMNGYPSANPYPKQSFMPKKPGGMQSLLNSFKSQDGSVDFNKMMNTAGQMMTAVNQVSSLVKGLGGMFKA